MSGHKIVDNPSSEDWCSFLNRFASGNLQQSFEFGEAAKAFNPHTKVVRLLSIGENSPVGLVQARYNARFGFGDKLEVGGVYGNGPVVADSENKERVLSELIETLEKHAIRNRVSEAFVYQLGKNDVLESAGYTLFDTFNVYRVSLRENVGELWSRIDHNKRRNIRKAQEQGVDVVQDTNYNALVSFYDMLKISGARAEFIPQPFNYFYALLKVFEKSGNAKIFLARLKGRRVAGVFVVVHGDTAYALAAGSQEESWKVRPNDILHWTAMKSACEERLSYYHMGHVSEPPPTESSSTWGLWRWKREWNGQLEKKLVYHKIYMPKFRKFVLTPYEKTYNALRKVGF